MKVEIRPFTEDALQPCARLAASSALKDVYGFTEDSWFEKLRNAGKDPLNTVFVAWVGNEVAGFAWVHLKGAFLVAPYLRFIAVDPQFQGMGVGNLLLHEFEETTKHLGKSFFLLVSDFNQTAQLFYEKHGYCKVGELPDFAVAGVAEVLMCKQNKVECE
ncbi:GNAT family N-acetyltransferase [Sphaerochaeta globosa]|jgi:ribosomal protein S18 acetylase RimI-like enzyme|uniref:GCN5-related N-acetyltransferase n=1 Tax=Sphaerochaeta globosa (strain ATCC BAA-1886 / DSM 22777 / Buddy) TaxID=158189 RepID=F0RRR4_SPHGB|nr:GNAT family N-acetyltransferase [Sphaerochaeta globosa]ADY14323.1 GCN5-related N-acetyltransferase [Sphaerochaeta globosa str. Buddy]